MSTPADENWIAFAERVPFGDQFPIWICRAGDKQVTICRADGYTGHIEMARTWTHWRIAHVPEPPKREPTQAEVDQQTLGTIWRGCRDWNEFGHQVLAWERKQVRALLERNADKLNRNDPVDIDCDLFDQLARRVGLTTGAR